jgi:hypothetical protein
VCKDKKDMKIDLECQTANFYDTQKSIEDARGASMALKMRPGRC